MRRVALLIAVVSLVFATRALASPGRHVIRVPTGSSSAFTFAVPESVAARNQPSAVGTSGELTENTPRCHGGVIDSKCPAGSYDVYALTGASPAAALRA